MLTISIFSALAIVFAQEPSASNFSAASVQYQNTRSSTDSLQGSFRAIEPTTNGLRNTRKQGVVNNGYFRYEITGDAKTDAQNYHAARDSFRVNSPQQYAEWQSKYKSDFVDGKYIISREIFDRMPKSKQEYVLANPGKYIIRKD